LVESASDVPQQSQSVEPIEVTTASSSVQVIPQQPVTMPTSVMMSTINHNSQFYEPLSQEQEVIAEERVRNVMRLAFWIRLYCILGMIISAFSIFQCWGSIVPLLFYTFGFFGTRRLNRCLLTFPLIITAFIGFGLAIFSIYMLINEYDGWEFLLLSLGVLHISIFSCVCKLMCRISKLSNEEWIYARLRIGARCCCC